jgi:hypothetical protein
VPPGGREALFAEGPAVEATARPVEVVESTRAGLPDTRPDAPQPASAISARPKGTATAGRRPACVARTDERSPLTIGYRRLPVWPIGSAAWQGADEWSVWSAADSASRTTGERTSRNSTKGILSRSPKAFLNVHGLWERMWILHPSANPKQEARRRVIFDEPNSSEGRSLAGGPYGHPLPMAQDGRGARMDA